MQTLAASLVLDARAELGEGPVWDPGREQLIWVDITRNAVHRFDPVTEADEEQDAGQPVGAAAMRAQGGLILAVRDGFALLDAKGLTVIAGTEADVAGNRMNDGKVDPMGRFWAGTMAVDMRVGAGALYRLDPDHGVHTMLTGLTISNGLGWSPDSRSMYFVDSGSGGVDVFDHDPETGAIRNRRRLIDVDGSTGVPDGMAVDVEGFLWVVLWGGGVVHRYAPDGALAGIVRLPVSQVTSCAFAGRDLGDLYITSASAGLSPQQRAQEPHAGGVFHCRPGVPGQAPTLYRG